MSHRRVMMGEMGGMTPMILMWPEFPNKAKEAMQQIDQMYYSVKAQKRLWVPEGSADIVNKVIFYIFGSRDLKTTRMSTVQKLGLAEIIMSHLAAVRNEGDRQELFNTYFYTTNYYRGDIPLSILSLVTSLSMAFASEGVLQCIGFWMLKAGLDNPGVLYIADDVTKDLETDEFPVKYDTLPQNAPLFTAAILIAIGKSNREKAPSKRLIDQVIKWIEGTPAVCFIPPQSSVFDILKWVLISEEDEARLQYAILFAIERGGEGAQLQVIPPLMTLIQDLRVMKEQQVSAVLGSNNSLSLGRVEVALDRLFQTIQILISSDILDRNEIHPIFESAEEAQFPITPFYEIMRSMYFSSIS